MEGLQLVVVTGLSGAGKSQAVHALEDLGFYCVDNLPPALIPTFAELCTGSAGRVNRAALVVDIRGREFFDHVAAALQDLETRGFHYQILFLEATDEALVNRYRVTRRRHPLAPSGRVLEGIAEERRRLEPLRGRAHRIIDTTDLGPRQLRDRLLEIYGEGPAMAAMTVNVVSFGFRHGLPRDADLVMDVRFLPNPHYVPSLRELTGNDAQVKAYLLQWPIVHRFLDLFGGLCDFLMPQYAAEGKPQVTLAIGCTGGRHRSVVVGNWLAERLRSQGFPVHVSHRDCDLPEAEAGDQATAPAPAGPAASADEPPANLRDGAPSGAPDELGDGAAEPARDRVKQSVGGTRHPPVATSNVEGHAPAAGPQTDPRTGERPAPKG
ncbi:MAG TPA: RNase adapter RapZ [Bacillota bacterium]|nr:RNase adapter RapZ [Bacillota bacterium]